MPYAPAGLLSEGQIEDSRHVSVVCSELLFELPPLEELSQFCITVRPTSELGDGLPAGFLLVSPPDDAVPRTRILQLTQELDGIAESVESGGELQVVAAIRCCGELTDIATGSPKHAFAQSKLGALSAVLHCAVLAVGHEELQHSCEKFLEVLCINALFGLEALRHDEVCLELLETMLSSSWGVSFNETCRLCLARYHEFTMDFEFKTHETRQLRN